MEPLFDGGPLGLLFDSLDTGLLATPPPGPPPYSLVELTDLVVSAGR